MSTSTRTFTAADHLKLADLYDESHDKHKQHVLLASEAFYTQHCTNGEIDWRHGCDHTAPVDEEAEALDGYVVPWNDPEDKPRLRDILFCLACIGGTVGWLWGLDALIRWRTS